MVDTTQIFPVGSYFVEAEENEYENCQTIKEVQELVKTYLEYTCEIKIYQRVSLFSLSKGVIFVVVIADSDEDDFLTNLSINVAERNYYKSKEQAKNRQEQWWDDCVDTHIVALKPVSFEIEVKIQ